MGFGPPGRGHFEYKSVEKPKSIGDVPRFLKELLGGFFSRLFYIFKLVWKTGPWILFVMSFIALFEGLSPVIGSLISKSILNELQDAYTAYTGTEIAADFLHSDVFLLLIFFFIHRILSQIINRINSAATRISGELVVEQVKMMIMEKTKELDLASFDMPAFYEKLENANREAGNRPIQILSSTFSIVSTSISLVSYIIILATAPGMWWTALIMIGISIPSAIVSFIYRRKHFSYMRFRSKDRRQMNYYTSTVTNKDIVKEIRMFDLADTFIDRYRAVFKHYYAGLKKLIITENTWHVVITLISALTRCVFFAMIAFQVFTRRIRIGDYSLFTGALTSIATNVSTLINTSATIYEGTLFIDNLISFMEEKQTVVPRLEKPERVAHGVSHTIQFIHVSFRYPGTERDVLKDINLTLRPGETMVLVGLNGAGKTTLIKLLTRLYDPTEGQILLDGKDLRDYDVKDLYSIFGIIFQDFGKYAFTVKENIAFGNFHKEHKDEDIRRAATEANADEYISKLPDGYDTPLMRIFEQNGLELSGGQWQKLAVARAFYADSDVLILDEPTSALDPMAEQEIYNQFDRLRKDKMTIFVSHRLSSATVASKIVVLEYGEIIEEGTHHELMEQHGKYYELFSTQAKRYLAGDGEQEDHGQ
ncbi:MAG: ABC transporter ATP-binding protein [Clostridia bacterium]|nr:ABC transporter ATP-binding protein [Clostridia bacterium]